MLTEKQIQAQIKMTAFIYMLDNGLAEAKAMYPEHAEFLIRCEGKTHEEVSEILRPELYNKA